MTRAVLFLLLSAGMVPVLDAGAAETDRPFDGTWDTVLSCANSSGALGYVFHFPSTIENGALRGGKGEKGQPGWLLLEGRIAEDGTADILATGLVGAAPFAVGQRPAGTEYAYHIRARFSDDSGQGSRVEGRPCTVAFARRR